LVWRKATADSLREWQQRARHTLHQLLRCSKDGLKPGKRNGRAARLALSRFIAYLHFQNTKRRL